MGCGELCSLDVSAISFSVFCDLDLLIRVRFQGFGFLGMWRRELQFSAWFLGGVLFFGMCRGCGYIVFVVF